jgi:protein gp37
MSDKSSIEWTDASLNFATGCSKVSPGCDHCYMFREYPRLRAAQEARGVGEGYAGGVPEQVRFFPKRLAQPARWKRPRMVFVNSMSDTFHSDLSNEQIAQMFDAMLAGPQHIYQVLTKRPNRVRRWWEWYRKEHRSPRYSQVVPGAWFSDLTWPANIWLGTSVESFEYLPRIERIAGIAPVTYLSAEPLLGPLWRDSPGAPALDDYLQGHLDWVIVGGESGPNHRPMNPEWVSWIAEVCKINNVPFFFKQWGGLKPKSNGRELNGRTYDEFPVT